MNNDEIICSLYEHYLTKQMQAEPLTEDLEYLKVLKYAVDKRFTSISDIQRHFKMGFSKAANYVADFINKGYVSSIENSKRKKVNLTKEGFKEKYNG